MNEHTVYVEFSDGSKMTVSGANEWITKTLTEAEKPLRSEPLLCPTCGAYWECEHVRE